ncbi:neuronal acetylcholine receptor subunit beta-4-like [Branchiostoma floridae]|uniref:Neuronal acetylcholine receptor subunit beta-4-like n=1 Tax=Branchiostoma floridae TaxID=7739 RepID=A0A9J7KIL6_BRAFL|nr:neuronal acetylcholine receptor subunit beta-4-like [Branchiostoma floridae]
MTSVVWLRQYWYDEALVWNSTNFWGISYINIPSNEVWLPDTVLYNSVGNDHNQLMTNVVINSAGYVTWMPPPPPGGSGRPVTSTSVTSSIPTVFVSVVINTNRLCFLRHQSWERP